MLTATDSFLQYLSTELAGIVPVYWWRQNAQDEHAGFLKQDALNVQYLGFYEDGSLERCLVSLDLLGSDERTVLGQMKAIRDVLLQAQFTAEMDWSIPGSPIPTGRTIGWKGQKLQFINVRTPRGARYSHYNCTFPLTYTRE